MSARLIVIEGLDGSGKATQAALLAGGLRAQGEKVREISFPDYKSRSSQLVQMYLAGEVGPLEEVNVYAASGFYSLDRYISYQTSWKEDYAGGGVIVADRYTTSNFCHQMGRLARAQWASYSRWLTEYEYERLGLPVPNLVVYLDMHPEASRRLIELRSSQTDRKKDLHEQNFAYLLSCREAALYAAGQMGWHVVPCSDERHQPYAVEVLQQQIWELVRK